MGEIINGLSQPTTRVRHSRRQEHGGITSDPVQHIADLTDGQFLAGPRDARATAVNHGENQVCAHALQATRGLESEIWVMLMTAKCSDEAAVWGDVFQATGKCRPPLEPGTYFFSRQMGHHPGFGGKAGQYASQEC